MVFSSAFATNLATIFSLVKGQSRDSVINNDVLVVSDALNHRSIIDGIRLAGLDRSRKAIFEHMDMDSLEQVLKENAGKFTRVVVVTDGVFSMLGEYQDIQAMQAVIDKYDDAYEQGIISIVDDCHGIAAFGETGRGTEEVTGGKADVLVGTLGKGLGADGGYVVADQVVIDYLRESGATYIYSNNITPGTAAAAHQSVKIIESTQGEALLNKLEKNIEQLKSGMKALGYQMAADSIHPIQPVLIGEPGKTEALAKAMYDQGFLVTNINYPVVPKGADEIRVQLSAAHTDADIQAFLKATKVVGETLEII